MRSDRSRHRCPSPQFRLASTRHRQAHALVWHTRWDHSAPDVRAASRHLGYASRPCLGRLRMRGRRRVVGGQSDPVRSQPGHPRRS
jgi:hypothetical protein